ncbi:Protein TAR1 [Capsicum annuum]|nr:Protein TAR1 [Capsicum annuum]
MPKDAGGVRCLPQSRRRRSTSVSRARSLAAPSIHAGPRPESIGGPARRRSTSDRGVLTAPIRFPPDNFKHSLTIFSKSFSSFTRGTCSLSVSRPYLALDGIHRPIWAAFPNNPTRRQRLVVRQGPGTTGLSPSLAPPSRGLGPDPPLRTLLQTTIRTTELPDSKAGLFPVRSPLLRESLQTCPRPNGFGRNLHSKTRWFMGFCNSHQVSHFATFFIDARAEISVAESHVFLQMKHRSPRRTPGTGREGQAINSSIPWCFPCRGFDNDPSAGSPTETLLRLLLSLNDKVQWTSRRVLKATSADPWSTSFMVETRTLFVFHKSKNFTSDYEIRMPPTVPVYHYSNPKGQVSQSEFVHTYTCMAYSLRQASDYWEDQPGSISHRRQRRMSPACP